MTTEASRNDPHHHNPQRRGITKMNYEEYLAKRRQDPEYRKAERQLKRYLDLLDLLFNIKMWLIQKTRRQNDRV